MNGVTLQAESHKQRIQAQHLLELCQDGNAAASSAGNGFDAVNLTDCFRCSLVCIGRNGDKESVTALVGGYLYLYVRGSDAQEMVHKEF